MLNSIKSLYYGRATAATDILKTLSILSALTVKRCAVEGEGLKPISGKSRMTLIDWGIETSRNSIKSFNFV